MNRRIGKTELIFYDIIITGLVFLAILGCLLHWTPYRLEFKEQMSIFLLGADRINWYLSNPAVAASIAGDWLTQFYINGKLGALLSVLLLGAVWMGLLRFLKLSENGVRTNLLVLTVPILLEAGFLTNINYPVSATVGLVMSVWMACGLVRLKDSRLKELVYMLAVPAVFVIAGFHALTFALMLGMASRRKLNLWGGLIAGIILMMVCGKYYNLTPVQTLMWPFSKGYMDPSRIWIIAQPLFILSVLVLSVLIGRIKHAGWMIGLYTGFMAISLGVFNSSVKSELENVVKIGTLAYHNQWKDVARQAQQDLRTQYAGFYWNVCNAREGRLAENLLKGQWASSQDVLFLSTGSEDPYFSMIYFTDALLEMGDVSQATDCALLAQTVMPGHYSTRMLRRLAEIAVVTADYDVARKYLDILMRTRNHRQWAQDLMECIETGNIPEQYLKWRSRTVPNDRFFAQGDIRSSLAIIAQECPYNRVAIDYLLCANLLDKKINTFVSLYDKYYLNALDRIVTVPDLYQEALLVNVSSSESLRETVDKYHISQNVVDKFLNQLEARSESNDPHVLTGDARGTYWHYIMAVRFNNNQE